MADRYLTKDDVQKKIYGLEQYQPGSRETKHLHIKTTSGTTGGGITLIVIRKTRFPEKDMYLTNHLRVLAHTAATNTSALGQVSFAFYQSGVRRVMTIDKKDIQRPQITSLLDQFEPTEISITPSSLFHILWRNSIHQGATWPSALRRLYLSGEPTHASHYEMLTKTKPSVSVLSDYGLAETDTVSYSCPHLTKKYYDDPFVTFHPIEKFGWRIGEPNEDDVGEIIIMQTNELKSGYRTGDLGKLVREKCPCGAQKTLYVYGRKDYDIVYCAGATFVAMLISRIFNDFVHSIADYRIEVREKTDGSSPRGSVRILIVPHRNAELEELKKIQNDIHTAMLKRLFVTKTRTLENLVQEGIFSEPTIETVKSLNEQIKKIHLIKKWC